MQIDSVDQVGRNVAASGMAAEGALQHIKQMEQRRSRAGRMEFTDQFLPRANAMDGLIAAIPLSLSLWGIIALSLWALVR